MSHARQENGQLKQIAPEVYDAVAHLAQLAGKAGLDKQLLELLKIRASQINGCAFCVQYHILIAEKLGVPADKINLVVVWRETPQFSKRERAALAWTEAVTLISETHAPDDVYNEVRAQFSEAETVNLTMLIATINAWNRLAISFRSVPPVKVSATAA